MPTAGRLTWTEKLDAIQARMNEAFVAVDPQLNVPYFDRTEIERILLEVSNANLRELSIEDISAVGRGAIDEYVDVLSPITTLDMRSIDVVSAKISDLPMIEVIPAQFFQNNYAGVVTPRMFSIFSGGIYFPMTGTATFEVLTYQSLTDWQATPDILPPGYDEKVIREVCEILELADYVPVERI